jgi:hypothetical protein
MREILRRDSKSQRAGHRFLRHPLSLTKDHGQQIMSYQLQLAANPVNLKDKPSNNRYL